MVRINGRKYISYKEGPDIYGVSFSTFKRLAKRADAAIRDGRYCLVDCTAFDDYLERFRLTETKY